MELQAAYIFLEACSVTTLKGALQETMVSGLQVVSLSVPVFTATSRAKLSYGSHSVLVARKGCRANPAVETATAVP